MNRKMEIVAAICLLFVGPTLIFVAFLGRSAIAFVIGTPLYMAGLYYSRLWEGITS